MSPALAQHPLFFPIVAALHLLTGLLLGGLLAVRMVRRPEERLPTALTLAAAVAWTALALNVVGPALPTDVWTLLQEGPTEQQLKLAVGQGTHTGPSYRAIWLEAVLRGPLDAREVITLNVWMAGIGALVFHRVASATAGQVIGTIFSLLLCLNSNYANSSVSDQPAPVIALLLLLGTIPLGAMGPRAGRRERWVAGVALAALTADVAMVRMEAAGFGLLALVAWAVILVHPDPFGWEDRHAARLGALGARMLREPWWPALALVLAWPLAAWLFQVVHFPTGETGRIGWLARAMPPYNLASLTLPLMLLTFLPLGATALATAGLGWSLARPLRSGGAAVGLLVLYATYHSAAHGHVPDVRMHVAPFELYRYTMLLAPVALLLAAPAWAALAPHPTVRRGLLLACLVPPLPEAMHLMPGSETSTWTTGVGLPRFGLIAQDPQIQARMLFAWRERAPACGMITRAMPYGSIREDRADAYAWLGPRTGGRVTEGERSFPRGTPMDQVLEDLLPGADCVLFIRSIDCNTVDGEDCSRWTQGLEPLELHELPHRPFIHTEHGPVFGDRVVLGIYPLRGSP